MSGERVEGAGAVASPSHTPLLVIENCYTFHIPKASSISTVLTFKDRSKTGCDENSTSKIWSGDHTGRLFVFSKTHRAPS